MSQVSTLLPAGTCLDFFRAQGSAFPLFSFLQSSILHRFLQNHALALSACRFARKSPLSDSNRRPRPQKLCGLLLDHRGRHSNCDVLWYNITPINSQVKTSRRLTISMSYIRRTFALSAHSHPCPEYTHT